MNFYLQKFYGQPDPGNTFAFRKQLKEATGQDHPPPDRTYFNEHDGKEYIRLDKKPPLDNPISQTEFNSMDYMEQQQWLVNQKKIQKTRWSHYTPTEKRLAGYYSWENGQIPLMPPPKHDVETSDIKPVSPKTTAKYARNILLENAEEIISTYISIALGKEIDYQGDIDMLGSAFKAVLPSMRLTDDADKIIENEDLNKKQTSETIIHKMLAGELTAEKAKDMLVAIQDSYDINEIESLLGEMNE